MNSSKKYKKIVQFSSGRGPVECEWVVARLIKLFYKELEEKQIEYKVLESTLGQQAGTLQSVTLELYGEDKIIEPFLKNWKGVIQFTGKSMYRKFHKRKNWFVGVHEVSNLSEIQISDSDIKYQAVRARGAGGQNVNKVNTAVRATHSPTLVSVFAMDSRSQLENKKLAKKRLLEKLSELNLTLVKEQIQEKWNQHLNLERGNPTRIFSEKDLFIN
ncbi:peptide chain release factor H [Apibacter raozihei]|uniref:peptide chain release factor H n=1 Tax=Apibacter TaxID=1778601 RepID=UPI000FE413C9|nr:MULTISPECIES: peptide chain release factor H [Apibacter]